MSDNCPADRSAMMNSIMLSADNNSEAIKKLKAEIEELEDKLEKGRNEVFELQKKNNSYKSKTDELSRANAEIEK
jgi:predicted RNase H-like nuclease (RuvC/YqgF family)